MASLTAPGNVMILGSPGSGKSTLARALGEQLGHRVVHMDQLYWAPGWRMRDPRETIALVHAELAEDGWIFDGNHSATWDARLARADLVVWLDLPRWVCLAGVLSRIARTHGRVRLDMAPECPERLDAAFLKWVWNFPRHTSPRIASLMSRAPCETRRLTSRLEVRRFLQEFEADSRLRAGAPGFGRA